MEKRALNTKMIQKCHSGSVGYHKNVMAEFIVIIIAS